MPFHREDDGSISAPNALNGFLVLDFSATSENDDWKEFAVMMAPTSLFPALSTELMVSRSRETDHQGRRILGILWDWLVGFNFLPLLKLYSNLG